MKKKIYQGYCIVCGIIMYPIIMLFMPTVWIEAYLTQNKKIPEHERPAFLKWYIQDWKTMANEY